MKMLLRATATVLMLAATLVAWANQTAQRFTPEEGRGYRYWLYIPADRDENERLPVILYLHGRSLSGTDLNRVKRYGLPRSLDRDRNFPFIVISPQTNNGWGDPSSLVALVDDVIERHGGDRNRVYITGMSMGGAGTWAVALAYPHRFAAIAPICAPAPETRFGPMSNLAKMPIWIFHGTADRVITPDGSRRAAESLRRLGNEPRVSWLEGRGHGIAEVFDREDLYSWFLQHELKPTLNSRHKSPRSATRKSADGKQAPKKPAPKKPAKRKG